MWLGGMLKTDRALVDDACHLPIPSILHLHHQVPGDISADCAEYSSYQQVHDACQLYTYTTPYLLTLGGILYS